MTLVTWVTDIQGALTVQVIVEYIWLWEILFRVQMQPEVEDRFYWRFGTDGTYSTSTAYMAMFIGSSTPRAMENKRHT